ncbi:MAG: hypothetical protein ACM3JG_04000 [Thiohalocapsa sp.]
MTSKAAATPPADTLEVRHRRWFAGFAEQHLLPMLTEATQSVERRGFKAQCRLVRDGDAVAGEMIVVPPGLPPRAAPPRLSVTAAPAPSGLVIEFTGTYPNAGAEGGFGAEVQYDTIYTDELPSSIAEFVALATGAEPR